MIEADFFSGNRARLRELSSGQPIVIAASGVLQRSGDTTFAFRQDSNFYYLSGINQPDLVLVIDGSEEYLIVPGRVASKVEFDGALDFGELSRKSGIDEILDDKAGWQKLKASLAKSKRVATLASSPSYIGGHYGFYPNPARARLIKKMRRAVPGLAVNDVREELMSLRVIKQPAELGAIQKAINITLEGIKQVEANLGTYDFEYEIEAELSKQFRLDGGSGHAFTPITASGKNACTIHHIENNSRLNPGDLVLLDVGAEADNYAADISRTLAFGQPSVRQQQIFTAVKSVQTELIKLVKPGLMMRDWQRESDRLIGEQLKKLGLISRVDEKSVRHYYNHAIGHFMGLDCHDVGDYRKPLEENMVITCEPGIYISEEGIGVRIEDDILVTKDGCRVLSQALPSRLC